MDTHPLRKGGISPPFCLADPPRADVPPARGSVGRLLGACVQGARRGGDPRGFDARRGRRALKGMRAWSVAPQPGQGSGLVQFCGERGVRRMLCPGGTRRPSIRTRAWRPFGGARPSPGGASPSCAYSRALYPRFPEKARARQAAHWAALAFSVPRGLPGSRPSLPLAPPLRAARPGIAGPPLKRAPAPGRPCPAGPCGPGSSRPGVAGRPDRAGPPRDHLRPPGDKVKVKAAGVAPRTPSKPSPGFTRTSPPYHCIPPCPHQHATYTHLLRRLKQVFQSHLLDTLAMCIITV